MTSKETTPPLPGTIPDNMFPPLSREQQARVAAHGRERRAEAGETVFEPNAQVNKFFVVVTGQLDVLGLSKDREELVAICGPGMFTGELNMLSGRRGLVRIRVGPKSNQVLLRIGFVGDTMRSP